MWIRVLLITLLITSLAFVQAKRKQSETKPAQQPKFEAKKLTTKTITKQKSSQPKLKNQKPLWLLSVIWPAGYCQKYQCTKTFLNNWDHQSFVINGLIQINKQARKQAKKPQLNQTIFKTETLKQNLKNYFPPSLKETKSKNFSAEAWVQQWETNGYDFDQKNQSKYFQQLVSIYKSVKGLRKITNVTKNQVKSKKVFAKLLGLEQNSFSVECNKVNQNNLITQIDICLSLKNNQFSVSKCNAKQLKSQCSYPLTLNDLNQKWTKQRKWQNPSLITNYLVDPQYDIPSPFNNVNGKSVQKQNKKVQIKLTATNITIANKNSTNTKKQQKKNCNQPKKQQSSNVSSKCIGSQKKNSKKTFFKSKQVSGKVQLSWLLGQCLEANLKNQKNQCQWDQIFFWDHQSFVLKGLETYPNAKSYKKQIKALKKIFNEKELNFDILFNDTEQISIKQIWPQSILQNENSWHQSWKNQDNGIKFLITLKQILPHLFSYNNSTDFSQFQREYFEIAQEYYDSLEALQKIPKNIYKLQQLAKLLGLSTKNINIQCAHTKRQKTNFLTSLQICVKLFSKDNETISIKTSECNNKQKYQGCSLGKDKKISLLFWRNRSSQTAPYWGDKYIKVIIPVSKFVKPEQSQQSTVTSSKSSQNVKINTQSQKDEENEKTLQQNQQQPVKLNNAQQTQTQNSQTQSVVRQDQTTIANTEIKQDQKDFSDQKQQEKDQKETVQQAQLTNEQAKGQEEDSVQQTEQIKQDTNSEKSVQNSRKQQLSQIQL